MNQCISEIYLIKSGNLTILLCSFKKIFFNPLYLGYLHCNEYDSLRLRWLRQTLESFIPQPLVNVIKVSELDGREMGDAQPETFDKVLLLHCDRLIDSQ